MKQIWLKHIQAVNFVPYSFVGWGKITNETHMSVRWGIPRVTQGAALAVDAKTEEKAISSLRNISVDEVTRRYVISTGSLAVSVGIVAFTALRGHSKAWRLLTIAPNLVAAVYFNSARYGI